MTLCVLTILTLALGIAHAKNLRGLQQEEPIFAIPVEVNRRRDPLLNGLNVPTNAAQVGMWGRLNRWPIVAVHSAVMPDGRIVTYGAMPDEQFQDGRSFVLWDPRMGFQEEAFEVVPNAQTVDSFCSSATLLSDGSFLVSGGAGEKIAATSRESSVFDWKTGESRRVEDMEMRRWYGTMTALPDGRALMTGGGFPYAISGWQDPIGAASVTSSTPEVYTEGVGWRLLDSAFSLDAFGAENNRYWYPRQWVTPFGTVFGISTDKMWEMTLQGDGGIRTIGDFKTAPNATSLPNVGPTSTAVMYDQGKILQVGGNGYANFDNSPSSAEATIFDINGINNGDVEVTEVDGMNNPRQWANAVVLPDGKVLVTGGTRFGNDGGNDAVLPAEIWDPVTKSWTVAASMAVYRGYHSSVALLPNGALLSTGGGIPGPVTHLNAEIFYPPYLFKEQDGVSVMAKRPSIVSISDNGLDYAQKVQVQVGSEDDVAQVSLIALPTNTHSFDSNQRRLVLTFQRTTSGVEVTMPSNRNLAPPGFYYLSVVNAAQVPSNAVIVSLQSAPPPLPPVGLPESPTPAPGPVFEPIRINTGGPLHVDVNFNVWQADEYFGGNGGAFCQLQGFTKPDGQIFGCERFYNKFVHNKPFAYVIPVDAEPAEYNVVLSFTEVFFQEPNKRVFDVFVNGAVVASALDIFEVAGYQTTHMVVAQPFVSNGNINITFVDIIENPKISGIEITKISGQALPTKTPTVTPASEPTSTPTGVPTSEPTAFPVVAPLTRAPTKAPVPSPTTNTPTIRPTLGPTAAPTPKPSANPTPVPTVTPTTTPVFAPVSTSPTDTPVKPQTLAPVIPAGTGNGRINLGASVPFIDETSGLIWQADPYTSGFARNICATSFQRYRNAEMFCQYREWISTSGALEIPIPSDGLYTVILYFVNAGNGANERVFDIFVEGNKVVEALDVAAQIGQPTGWYTYGYRRFFTGGKTTLELKSVTGNPTLAAIHVMTFEGDQLPTPAPGTSPTTPSPVTASPTAAPAVSAGNDGRINLGASIPFIDEVDGLVWQPDPFVTGTAQSVCDVFQGFQNEDLFCQYREWPGESSGLIHVAVPFRGAYNTILYFTNAGNAAGEQIIQIYLEGRQIGGNLDVASELRGSIGTYTYTVGGFISDGSVSIELKAVAGRPSLAAIQVVPAF